MPVPPNPPRPPAVLSYTQAAHYLGLSSVGALRNLVYRRSGPPSIKFGVRARHFRVRDIEAWLESKACGKVASVVKEAGPPQAPKRRGRPTKAEAIARRM